MQHVSSHYCELMSQGQTYYMKLKLNSINEKPLH